MHITTSYGPQKQTFSHSTRDSPRIENDGGSLWKRLCSCQGLAHTDDDDDDDEVPKSEFLGIAEAGLINRLHALSVMQPTA